MLNIYICRHVDKKRTHVCNVSYIGVFFVVYIVYIYITD